MRSTEMNLMEELKKLNEELSKEDAEYKKEHKNLTSQLNSQKKDLVKTKNEAKILHDFRVNY